MTATRVRPRRRTRTNQRLLHLAAAVGVLAYVYATPDPASTTTDAIRWVTVPAIVLSGLMMWQAPRIRRRMARRRPPR